MKPLSRAELAEVAAIFGDAVDLHGDERAALLDERCGERAAVRAEVDSLFDVHARADSRMEPLSRHDLRAEPEAADGMVLGAWRLLRKIGSGGMGDVYLAERGDGAFDGYAAVKLTRALLPDMDAARRFRAERQFLASLHHPNIVTLLDGGTSASGLGYLVMEHVDGTPINKFCNDSLLSLEARLVLMRKVCTAVQYAHQRAIVHRDLKPSNILVTADGVPKILDFGVAKLVEGTAADGNLTVGMPLPLTPNYASPEQLRGLPVTTACDVYALGVLLYEVVAGARPYETTGQTLDAIIATVVDTEPPRPSDAPSATALPYARGTLRGDLDAIVLKAMRKDPAERYGSAGELGDDLDRVVSHEPVVARAPSIGYLLRRMAARHRAAVTIAVLSLILIMAASGTALWQAGTARAERDRARIETAKAQQVSTFVRTLFSSSAPKAAQGEKLSAQDLLDTGAARLERDLGGQPAVQAAMFEVLGSVYSDMSLFAQALPLLERSLTMRERLLGPDHVEVADSLLALGQVKVRLGDYAEAQQLFERAIRIRETAGGVNDPLLPPTLSALGATLWRRGQYYEGRDYLNRAVSIEEKAGGEDLLKWLTNLSNLELDLGDFERAQQLLERALALGVKIDGRKSARVDVTMLNLGTLLRSQEDYSRAKPLLEEALQLAEHIYGQDHQGVSYTLGELGDLYFAMGEYEKAGVFIDRSIAMAERVLGNDHPGLAAPLTYRGRLLMAEGKPRPALVALERSHQLLERSLGDKHKTIAESLVDIAGVKSVLEGHAAAEPILRRALAIQRETLVAGHRGFVPTMTALGTALQARGEAAEAAALLREAVDIARRRLPEGHSQRQRAEAAFATAGR